MALNIDKTNEGVALFPVMYHLSHLCDGKMIRCLVTEKVAARKKLEIDSKACIRLLKIVSYGLKFKLNTDRIVVNGLDEILYKVKNIWSLAKKSGCVQTPE